MPARHDEAGRAEHRRRAQDGADVVRVGHLVEQDDGPAAAHLREVGERGLRQGLGLDQGALVHGVGAEPAVEVPGQHPLVGQLPRRQRCLQPAFGIVGEIQPEDVALRVGECRLHGVDAEDLGDVPARRCVLPAAGLTLATLRVVAGPSAIVHLVRLHAGSAAWAEPTGLTAIRPFLYARCVPAGDSGAILFCARGGSDPASCDRYAIAVAARGLTPSLRCGGVPEWLKGTDCKSVGYAYAGSNPAPSTITSFLSICYVGLIPYDPLMISRP